jgi:hypothetical protein
MAHAIGTRALAARASQTESALGDAAPADALSVAGSVQASAPAAAKPSAVAVRIAAPPGFGGVDGGTEACMKGGEEL